jgi:nicotinate phosphoribosyltransferase
VSTFSLGFAELLLAGRMRQAGCSETWTFEISLPALPPRRSFLIAAGLEQAVAMLEQLAGSGPDLAGLDGARLPAPLDVAALKHVAAMRFTGHVEAVPEGTVIFAGEPVVRLRAPAPEAVLVGAALVGLLRSQTAVATKAARLVLAANGKPVYEVGVRSAAREAALLAARSAHVGGASATSNAVASIDFGLPTMAVVPLSLVTALGGNVDGLEQCGVMVDGALASEGEAALAALSDAPRAVILDAGTKGLAERVKSLRAGIQSLGWRTTRSWSADASTRT